MPLRTEVTNVTFDDTEAGAPASLTRSLARTVIQVLALVYGDASPFHIESYSDEARRDTNEIQAVGGEAFVSSVPGTQLPGPGMKIIKQDLRFDGTITVGDKLTASVTTKEKQKKYAVVIVDYPNREPVGGTYDTGERSQ
jgi:phosphate acetyltransferase